MKARGGKSIYGASVGILMLDARFPRIIGDMGNALTWDFPVHYKVVRSASPDLVVRKGAAGTLGLFIDANGRKIKIFVISITMPGHHNLPMAVMAFKYPDLIAESHGNQRVI